MKTSNYFSNTMEFLKNFKEKKGNTITTTNESTHPRFEMTSTEDSNKKEDTNSLLFLMYSKENETLFI